MHAARKGCGVAIKKLSATNFRSFERLEVEFGAFNVLIGPNASGKSNLVQCLKFLRDVAGEGLDNAVSMQGGAEYMRNVNLSGADKLSIQATFDQRIHIVIGADSDRATSGPTAIEAVADGTTYDLAMRLTNDGRDFEVVDESISFSCQFYALHNLRSAFMSQIAGRSSESLGSGRITVSRSEGELALDFDSPEEIRDTIRAYLRPLIKGHNVSPRDSIIEQLFLHTYPSVWRFFDGIATYDFDPRLAKRAVQLNGRKTLEEDGSNLAIVLRDILEDEDRSREFSNLIRDLMPFVSDLGVERFVDRSLLFNLREGYSNHPFPAFLLSDGTVGVASLITALYFEDNPVVIVEEPERNIHPHLISRVVEMLREASQKKQVIVTTHSPQVVESAGLDNILLVSRDREGYSRVTRPAERRDIQVFLEHEIGLQELFTQNLLGA